MSYSFTKLHATGNDFLCFKEEPLNPSEVAKKTCHRRFGFGADGILYPSVSEIADIKMNYLNADGTIASMCGNGYRAFIVFCLKEGLLSGTTFKVETRAGVIESTLHEDHDVELVFTSYHEEVSPPHVHSTTHLNQPLNLEGMNMHVMFIGTLHGMIIVDDPFHISDALAHRLCTHDFFPHHINVNFIKIIDQKNIQVRTYERGVGWTYSCGTGSVASAYLIHHLYEGSSTLHVHVLGGQLEVKQTSLGWSLKGPAHIIGEGVMV